MSDSEHSDPAAKRGRSENYSLGAVFAAVGVTLMLTLDSWVIGLPFVILGISFLTMAFTSSSELDEDDGPTT
jgi:hypothetical protein